MSKLVETLRQVRIDWGSLPDWIAALGTILAFVVALTVLVIQLVDRQRNAAGRVYAWLDSSALPMATLHLTNAADEPVYDCTITPEILGQVYEMERRIVPLVLPGSTTDFSTSIPGGSATTGVNYLGVAMSYRDAHGRRWRRDRSGKLKRSRSR